jgi:hypothetical protein
MLPHTVVLLCMDVVQSLVELFLAVEKFDFLVNPVFGGLDGGSFVLWFVAVDLDIYVVRFYLLYFTHFVKPSMIYP